MLQCHDIPLAALLESDVDIHNADIMQHVENCQCCQHRLDELAAAESEWQKTVEVLSSNTRASGGGADGCCPSLHTSRIHFGQPAWTESMARQLLSPPSHPEMLGRIGRYDVERLIGSGGMGVVFKAWDTELNRPVAVKLLAPYLASSGAARKRFAREARAAAAVVDDHVVPIHNVETDDEHPFLVMKYIAGGSLQQRLDCEGPFEVCEVLRIGMQTSKGLAAAHTQGLIHRDVKPSNILLDEGVDRALLTDFGLARATDDASLTRSGFHPGTPHYMSPEQVRGAAIDARSDLFGLGCVLYALCTGHPPFRSETTYAVLRRITDDEPRPIRETNPDVPAWLEQIVVKLLSKSPDERFESAEEVAELLEDCLAHVQQPTTTPLPAAVQAFAARAQRPSTSTLADRRKAGFQRNRRPPIGKFIAVAAFAFGLFFAGVLIVLELNKGTLTIECDADDVPIRIMQGDKIVEQLVVTKAGESVRIAAGQYVIEIDGPHDGLKVDKGVVSITRGERSIVTVTANAAVAADEQIAHENGVSANIGPRHGRFQCVVEATGGVPAEPNGPGEQAKLQARAFIEKGMIGLVRVGSPATVKIDALPVMILDGKVTSVSYVADPPMRNGVPGAPFETIISFDPVPGLLKPGMTGAVDIVDDSGLPIGRWPELEGTWKLVSITSTEEFVQADLRMLHRERSAMIILGNRRISTRRDGQYDLTEFVYDPQATPQTFDTLRTRNGKPFRSHCIVAIDGDKLRFGCSMNGGNQRPKSFDAPRVLIEHYERVAPNAARAGSVGNESENDSTRVPAPQAEDPTPQNESDDAAERRALDEISDSAWGPETDGLRMALVALSENSPADEAMKVLVAIENVSDEPLAVKRPGMQSEYDIRRTSSAQVQTIPGAQSGMTAFESVLLQPGQRMQLSVFRVRVTEDDDAKSAHADADVLIVDRNAFRFRNAIYVLRCSVRLDVDDAELKLTSGQIGIAFSHSEAREDSPMERHISGSGTGNTVGPFGLPERFLKAGGQTSKGFTVDKAVTRYNEETAEDRRKLFDPPLSDLTLEQFKQSLLAEAESARMKGRMDLADILTEMGTTGTWHEDCSELFVTRVDRSDVSAGEDRWMFAPAFVHNAGNVIVLQSLVLTHRNGRTSTFYDDESVKRPADSTPPPTSYRGSVSFRLKTPADMRFHSLSKPAEEGPVLQEADGFTHLMRLKNGEEFAFHLERDGVKVDVLLTPSIPDKLREDYLRHDARLTFPLVIVEEDIQQAIAGNRVTKAIVARARETGPPELETITSTRLDPSEAAVEVATEKGTVLAVMKMEPVDGERLRNNERDRGPDETKLNRHYLRMEMQTTLDTSTLPLLREDYSPLRKITGRYVHDGGIIDSIDVAGGTLTIRSGSKVNIEDDTVFMLHRGTDKPMLRLSPEVFKPGMGVKFWLFDGKVHQVWLDGILGHSETDRNTE